MFKDFWYIFIYFHFLCVFMQYIFYECTWCRWDVSTNSLCSTGWRWGWYGFPELHHSGEFKCICTYKLLNLMKKYMGPGSYFTTKSKEEWNYIMHKEHILELSVISALWHYFYDAVMERPWICLPLLCPGEHLGL